jgi:hypothetical protein
MIARVHTLMIFDKSFSSPHLRLSAQDPAQLLPPAALPHAP